MLSGEVVKATFKTIRFFSLMMSAALLAAHSANAKNFSRGRVNGYVLLSVDVQGAAINDDRASTSTTNGNVDWTVLLNLENRADNGLITGFRFEVDQNFDADTDRFNTGRKVRIDEVYVYAASRFGRLEAGEQDGPADSLSFYAPVFGAGQIHGDFARYASGQARLKPFDSRDALKVIYITPPAGGFRAGASWGPHLRIDRKNPVARRRTIQRDPVEVAAQYQTPLGDNISLGISGAYVHANADPVTGRQNISSWSVGSLLRLNKLRVGGAYVSRGDSNSFAGRNEDEINGGISWYAGQWSLGSSYAHVTRSNLKRDLLGAGGSINITKNITLRSDIVYFNDRFSSGTRRDGLVALIDLRLHL